MPLFLRGKLITQVVCSILSLLELFSCAFFIYVLVNKLSFPTTLTKSVFVVAMVFHGILCIQCLATSHAIAIRSKKLSFKRWFLLLVLTTALDMWYFGLNAANQGYTHACDAGDGSCKAKLTLIGLHVVIFFTAIFRIFTLLVVWHWDVKWNQTSAAPTQSTPPTAAGASPAVAAKLNSLPKSLSKNSHRTHRFTAVNQEERGGHETAPLRASDFEVSDTDSEEDGSLDKS